MSPESISSGSASGSYRLVLLDCAQCGSPLAAQETDVIYYCTACYSGFRLDPAGDALRPVEVSFVVPPKPTTQQGPTSWRPFWLLPATLQIDQRKAAGFNLSTLGRFFVGGPEETGDASGSGTFAIPAFEAPLPQATALASRYTTAFPRLGERLGEKLLGGIYSAEDAQKLAHFTFIAAEAEKPDTLRELEYRIDFGPPRLLGVPFCPAGDGWVDGIFGLRG
jgi:hypothetical protein